MSCLLGFFRRIRHGYQYVKVEYVAFRHYGQTSVIFFGHHSYAFYPVSVIIRIGFRGARITVLAHSQLALLKVFDIHRHKIPDGIDFQPYDALSFVRQTYHRLYGVIQGIAEQ